MEVTRVLVNQPRIVMASLCANTPNPEYTNVPSQKFGSDECYTLSFISHAKNLLPCIFLQLLPVYAGKILTSFWCISCFFFSQGFRLSLPEYDKILVILVKSGSDSLGQHSVGWVLRRKTVPGDVITAFSNKNGFLRHREARYFSQAREAQSD